MKLKPA